MDSFFDSVNQKTVAELDTDFDIKLQHIGELVNSCCLVPFLCLCNRKDLRKNDLEEKQVGPAGTASLVISATSSRRPSIQLYLVSEINKDPWKKLSNLCRKLLRR